MRRKRKNGMALVVVFCIAAIILALGTVYVQMYSKTAPAAKLQYDRIQADFLAKGIQNIALLKIKKYPDFFIRAYRQHIYWKRTQRESSLPKLDAQQTAVPMPFTAFLNTGVLNGNYSRDFIEPLGEPRYTTDISLLSSKDFHTESIEISVNLKMSDEKAVNKYTIVFSGELKKNE